MISKVIYVDVAQGAAYIDACMTDGFAPTMAY